MLFSSHNEKWASCPRRPACAWSLGVSRWEPQWEKEILKRIAEKHLSWCSKIRHTKVKSLNDLKMILTNHEENYLSSGDFPWNSDYRQTFWDKPYHFKHLIRFSQPLTCRRRGCLINIISPICFLTNTTGRLVINSRACLKNSRSR